MKEKLFNNLSLKLLSIVCALILWIVIVNVYDPSTSVTVSGVNVELINTQSLTDKDYTYEIIDGSKISVYISGPRSIVTDIKTSDIVATADLSNVTVFSDYVDINVKVVKDGVAASAIEVAPRTSAIRLKVENRVSKTFTVDTVLAGEPADGYRISGQQVSPSSVKVTGTASAIESIASVRAVCDVSGATMDVNEVVSLMLIDAEGNEIKDEKLELSKNSVEVKVSVRMLKTVPVVYHTKGLPAQEFGISNIEYSVTEAIITGAAEQLAAVSSIEIPDTALDISGIAEDRTITLHLADYLPAGIELTSDTQAEVHIKVYRIVETTVAVPMNAIVVSNLPQNMTATFGTTEDLAVVIAGESTVLASLTLHNIVPTINLSDVKEGTVEVPVTFTLPANTVLRGNYTVHIMVAAKTN